MHRTPPSNRTATTKQFFFVSDLDVALFDSPFGVAGVPIRVLYILDSATKTESDRSMYRFAASSSYPPHRRGLSWSRRRAMGVLNNLDRHRAYDDNALSNCILDFSTSFVNATLFGDVNQHFPLKNEDVLLHTRNLIVPTPPNRPWRVLRLTPPHLLPRGRGASGSDPETTFPWWARETEMG